MSTKYKEVQRFTQWWIWILLLGLTLIPVYGVIQQLIGGKPMGDHPMSDTGLIIFLLLMLAFDYFFWMIRLITEIDAESIQIKFFPFVQREIKWSEVESYEIVGYGFVGGWGIRIGTQYGTVYNTRGRIGLALEMKNGKKCCIGTQQESELRAYLRRTMPVE